MRFVSSLARAIARSFPVAASWLSLLFCEYISMYSYIES